MGDLNSPNYPIVIDPVALRQRQDAIAELMGRVTASRLALRQRLADGDVNADNARQRNASMPGFLGELWGAFMQLPLQSQLDALAVTEYRGMAWQSLLQCSPYLERA
jgi:hypothetical protein